MTDHQRILVVGDWVVDDNWVTGVHRTATSGTPVSHHFRALHEPKSSVQSLGDAGQVVSVLHRATDWTDSPFFEVAAVGYWHKGDTNALAQMLEPSNGEKPGEESHTPYRLSRLDPGPDPQERAAGAERLFNLAEATGVNGDDAMQLKMQVNNNQRRVEATGVKGDDAMQHENSVDCRGTSRAIRIYQNKGKSLELVQRIDWETPPSIQDEAAPGNGCDGTAADDIRETTETKKPLLPKSLKTYLQMLSTEGRIHAVVIKDSCKGVVSKGLVNELLEQPQLKDAQWFISSRAWPHHDEITGRWYPEWLNELANVDVRLLVIPQVAVKRAVHDGVLSCWITKSGSVTRDAFNEIDRLASIFKNSRDLLAVVLPEGHVLARYMYFNLETQKQALRGLRWKLDLPQRQIEIPITSVFFPALVGHKLCSEKLPAGKTIPLEEILSRTLQFTKEWMNSEIDRVEKPEDSKPNKRRLKFPEDWAPGRPALNNKTSGAAFDTDGRDDFCWRMKNEIWKQALTELGVINEKLALKAVGEPAFTPKEASTVVKKWAEGSETLSAGFEKGKRLELWRAMTDVDGYVCCVDSKRKVLRKIVKVLNSFTRGGMEKHTSLMLIASPGSGKTRLVKRLAKTLKMQLLQFNITQMGSRDDLFGCFDTIIANQAQDPKEPILVFVDEINAELDGQHVYGTFLDPIQEGSYVRAGKTFRIGPCAWMFAGTERPDQARQDFSSKGSDFVSRLSLPPQNVKVMADDEKEQEKTEKVYLGVSLIQAEFPDVRKVSEKVLKLFHALPADDDGNEVGARDVGRFVGSFINVQHGEVRSRNIDIHDERFSAYVPDLWCSDPEGDPVEIRTGH